MSGKAKVRGKSTPAQKLIAGVLVVGSVIGIGIALSMFNQTTRQAATDAQTELAPMLSGDLPTLAVLPSATHTDVPSATPLPSETPIPSATMTATATITDTPVPMNTSTITPSPTVTYTPTIEVLSFDNPDDEALYNAYLAFDEIISSDLFYTHHPMYEYPLVHGEFIVKEGAITDHLANHMLTVAQNYFAGQEIEFWVFLMDGVNIPVDYNWTADKGMVIVEMTSMDPQKVPLLLNSDELELEVMDADLYHSIHIYEPDEAVFVVVYGNIEPAQSRACLEDEDLRLFVNDTFYPLDTGDSGHFQTYVKSGIDYPGRFQGHCVDQRTLTFMLFDVPEPVGEMRLEYADQTVVVPINEVRN